MEVLVLCSANQCRSPMAEVLLRARLADQGVDATVMSAGELPGGVPVSPGSVRAMATRGLDLQHHVSRSVTAGDVARADLVLTLARRHLRHAVAVAPDAFPRTFTLKELARRGAAIGPRRPDQPLSDWLAKVHRGRTTAALLDDDATDDVADPMGGPDRLYEAAASEIEALIGAIVDLAFAAPARLETG